MSDAQDAPIAEETAARLLAGRTVASAESCTGGLVAAGLVAVPGSGSWFRGGLVAYRADVKFELLGVRRGPVVCREAAAQMARGVRDLMGTDVAVSTTGVAGPEPLDGVAVGTVYVGVLVGERVTVRRFRLHGAPEAVRAGGACAAERELFRTLGDAPSRAGAAPVGR